MRPFGVEDAAASEQPAVGQVDQAAAVGDFVVETRPAGPLGTQVIVRVALPAKELLRRVVRAAQQGGLAAALDRLIVEADEHKGGEAADGADVDRGLSEFRVGDAR